MGGVACTKVREEMAARITSKTWVDPHNGGIYSIIANEGNLKTQRTTNPANDATGQNNTYTDKQVFVFEDNDDGCLVHGCSESQGFSVMDFSTNYCDLRNLYCGSQ